MSGRALILSSLAVAAADGEAAANVLERSLVGRGYAVETVDCRAVHVIPCTGCASCGMRTPGACMVNDDMQGIFRKLVACDVLVLATPVRFGSYCAELKKVVDRFQPLMVPVYVVRGGEMHFRGRYELPPLLGVGLVREPIAVPDESKVKAAADEAEAFRFLIGRLALNMDTRHATAVFSGRDEGVARDELEKSLEAVVGLVS